MPLVNSDNHGIPPNKLIHWLGSTILFTITQLTLGFFLSKHIKTNSAPAFEGAWCHLQCPGHTENLPNTVARCQEGLFENVAKPMQIPSGTASPNLLPGYCLSCTKKNMPLCLMTKANRFPKSLSVWGCIQSVTILLHVSVINMRNYKLRLAQDVVEGMQKKARFERGSNDTWSQATVQKGVEASHTHTQNRTNKRTNERTNKEINKDSRKKERKKERKKNNKTCYWLLLWCFLSTLQQREQMQMPMINHVSSTTVSMCTIDHLSNSVHFHPSSRACKCNWKRYTASLEVVANATAPSKQRKWASSWVPCGPMWSHVVPCPMRSYFHWAMRVGSRPEKMPMCIVASKQLLWCPALARTTDSHPQRMPPGCKGCRDRG